MSGDDPGKLRAVRYALLGDTANADVRGVALDWDGERQSFVGEPVEVIDIEVYRKAPAES